MEPTTTAQTNRLIGDISDIPVKPDCSNICTKQGSRIRQMWVCHKLRVSVFHLTLLGGRLEAVAFIHQIWQPHNSHLHWNDLQIGKMSSSCNILTRIQISITMCRIGIQTLDTLNILCSSDCCACYFFLNKDKLWAKDLMWWSMTLPLNLDNYTMPKMAYKMRGYSHRHKRRYAHKRVATQLGTGLLNAV